MRKRKFDIRKLATSNYHMGSSERYVIEQDNILETSNAAVNKDKQFFEMKLEIDATIKSLTTFTIDN